MTNPTLWNQLLVWPILNLLVAFYKAAEFLHLPGPLGFAIIFLTIFMRLLLYPLMNAQLKSAKQMSKLKPHLDALTEKHKGDKAALQNAQMALYKEHGVNPAAGCLPLLIQFPILIALYNVFYQVLGNGNLEKFIGDLNHVLYFSALKVSSLDFTFLGINLGIKPGEWQKYGIWLLAVPLVTAVLQWYQSKLMLPPSPKKDTKEVAKSDDQKKQDDMMEMQKQMALMTPIMFGFFALQLPLGLALYWNVFGIFGIMQQLKINKAND